MTTAAAVITRITDPSMGAAFLVTWTLSHTITAGDPVELPAWSDRSVQIAGTFDSATVVLQGSNDGTNYVTLTDPQGNSISKTSAAIEQVEEITRYMKPSHSGGTSSEALTVSLLVTGYRNW